MSDSNKKEAIIRAVESRLTKRSSALIRRGIKDLDSQNKLPIYQNKLEALRDSNIVKVIDELRFVENAADLVSHISFSRNGYVIKINAECHEVLRRTFEQNLINQGLVDGPEELSFDGTLLKHEEIVAVAQVLRVAEQQMLDNGYDEDEVKGLNGLADELERGGKEGDGTAIVALFDYTIPREEFRSSSHMGALGKSLKDRHANLEQLARHEAARKMFSNYLKRFYETVEVSSIVDESAAWIGGGLAEYIEITPDEADDFIYKWFKSYAEKNGIQSLDAFQKVSPHVRKFIGQVKREDEDSERPMTPEEKTNALTEAYKVFLDNRHLPEDERHKSMVEFLKGQKKKNRSCGQSD